MVEAAYRKYPNPHSAHVHSLDTVQRRLSGRQLYSHRLFCTMWSIPTLVLQVRPISMRISILKFCVMMQWLICGALAILGLLGAFRGTH